MPRRCSFLISHIWSGNLSSNRHPPHTSRHTGMAATGPTPHRTCLRTTAVASGLAGCTPEHQHTSDSTNGRACMATQICSLLIRCVPPPPTPHLLCFPNHRTHPVPTRPSQASAHPIKVRTAVAVVVAIRVALARQPGGPVARAALTGTGVSRRRVAYLNIARVGV